MIYSPVMNGGYLRIGAFSERVGVTPDRLRVWERRYDLLTPDRSAGGYRLYSDEDVERVRRMTDHLARGLSAAQAARLAALPADGATTETGVADLSIDAALDGLYGALLAFDEVAVHAVFDRLLSAYRLETVLRDVVLPCLARIGDGWADGEVSVAQEHFASGIVRGRLLALARGWGDGTGPSALLAAPPGEDHDLALVVFGLVLWRRGWTITFLGADTPMGALADTVTRLAPTLVVLTAIDPAAMQAVEDEVSALCGQVDVAIAGAGTDPGYAARTGASLLEDDPVTAAERLPVTGAAAR